MDSGQRTISAILVGLALTFMLMAVIGRLVSPSPSAVLLTEQARRSSKPLHRVTTRVYRRNSKLPPTVAKRMQPAQRLDEEKKKEAEKKKKKPEDKLNGQVVETARPETEEAPKLA